MNKDWEHIKETLTDVRSVDDAVEAIDKHFKDAEPLE